MIKHIDLSRGRISVTVNHHHPEWKLDDLLSFPERINPKRAFLFVSKVLGKHIPVAPSVMQKSYQDLAALIPKNLPYPISVIGMAETAVGLGAGFYRELKPDFGENAIFLTTTRHPVETLPTLGLFLEEHSHAQDQFILSSHDAIKHQHILSSKTLILVDDEISTGKTFRNLILSLKKSGLEHVEQIILVTHSSKASIENYFDRNFELETILNEKKKLDLLAEITQIVPSHVSVVSVRQPQPLGLGHAVLCAKSVVGQDDFAVLLPDVLVKDSSGQNDLSRMISRYDESNAAQIMVEAVPDHLVDQYGIVDVAQSPNEGESIAMQGIVEKPAVGSAPSNLSVVGRYVLPARIMELLENTPKGAGNEIQLTDAIAMLQQTDVVEAYRMQGQTFDCGSKLGYLKAVLHYGIEHPKLGNDFKQLIQELKL